jgi:hypothetical protein
VKNKLFGGGKVLAVWSLKVKSWQFDELLIVYLTRLAWLGIMEPLKKDFIL